MFNLLTSTLESQASDGDFAEAGAVERVSVEPEGGDGGNVRVVVGVLAAAAAVAGGFMYHRRLTKTAEREAHTEKGGETSESDDELPVAEAQVIAVEDDGDEYKKKKGDKKKDQYE